ncbi:hypothetical protein L596_014359 [Steinernema carpocapsae]|uniref:Uncharacterized protein n=1 Tax=Steinernema carpocapsae TaxID=34508 RepID=A0A4U5NBW9_STECR|nr:hypothetical protein L596_014359 [Steinernema carpocapsae]
MKLELKSLGIHVEAPFTKPLTTSLLDQIQNAKYHSLLASSFPDIPPREDPNSKNRLFIAPIVVIVYASEVSDGGTFTWSTLNVEAEGDRNNP